MVMSALLMLPGCRRDTLSVREAGIRGDEPRVSGFPEDGSLIQYGRHWLYQPETGSVLVWQPQDADGEADESEQVEDWRHAVRERLISHDGRWFRHFPGYARFAGDDSHWPWPGPLSADLVASWNRILGRPGQPAVLINYPKAHCSPDGRSLVEAEGERLLSLRTLDHPEPEVLGTPPAGHRVFAARWAPDGRRIAVSLNDESRESGSIWICDPATRTAGPIFSAPAEEGKCATIHDLSWSPDGRRIAFVSTLGRGCRGGQIGITGARECFFDLHAIRADGGGLQRLLRARSSSNPLSPPSVCWFR